jgi:hypothetical protein
MASELDIILPIEPNWTLYDWLQWLTSKPDNPKVTKLQHCLDRYKTPWGLTVSTFFLTGKHYYLQKQLVPPSVFKFQT